MSEQFLQLHNKYDGSSRLSVNGSTVNNNLCLLCYKVVHSAEGTYVHLSFFASAYIITIIITFPFYFFDIYF